MKVWQETVTKREGEFLGKISESGFIPPKDVFPFNPEERQRRFDMIIEIEKLFHEGKKISVAYDSMISGEVQNVGMYDGWPHWKPYPSLRLSNWAGGEIYPWYNIHSYKIIE